MNNQSEQEEFVNQIYDYAATLMFKHEKSAQETKLALINEGLDSESASIVVSNLEQQLRDVQKDEARNDMVKGALWTIGGVAITWATYSAASGGGTYVITWGAIIFGAIQFFRGLINYFD
jgi:hypothetical protein